MKNKKKLFLIFLFLFYILLIIFLFFHHENWRDEAQAYLICRDMNLFQIWKNVPYEGHPILYYLVLYPFVHLGVGSKIVNIFSLFFMVLAVYILLFHSSLNIYQKIGILISYPVLYEFSVVGRSYSLIFLLLVVFGLLYKKRFHYPILFGVILGLLLNTHLLMFVFVMINAFIFYVLEFFIHRKDYTTLIRRKLWFSFFVFLFFALVFLFQFYPLFIISDGLSLNKRFSFISWLTFLFNITFNFSGSGNILVVLPSIVLILSLIICLYFLNKKVFLIFIVNHIFMSFLLVYIFQSFSIYHLSLAVSVLFCCFYMIEDISFYKSISVCFIGMSFLSVPVLLSAYSFDINHPYSNGYSTAIYMNKHIDSKAIMLCSSDALCSSMIPYVNHSFYNTRSRSFFTYIVWNKEREQDTNLDLLEKFIQSHERLYYVYTGYDLDDQNVLDFLKKHHSLELVFESLEASYSKENYIIYQINKEDNL